MIEVLETFMLLCFGLSWPVSLFRSLRAGSARSSSLAFMCLILAGYFAGIAAKVMPAGCGFVFYVYLFNILMVAANLIVTLYNRAKDRKSDSRQQTKLQTKQA